MFFSFSGMTVSRIWGNYNYTSTYYTVGKRGNMRLSSTFLKVLQLFCKVDLGFPGVEI